MALLTIEFRSEALTKVTSIKVILNQNAAPPYPTFYLLHGLSDNETVWTRRTSIERYAEAYPFLIVMPDGERSWYCDSLLGNYETYIRKELVNFIDNLFPTRRDAKYRAIGGLSMGGYGSMKLGLKFPDTFGSITSHSAAFGFMKWGTQVTDIPEVPVIMNGIDRDANDPVALAVGLSPQARPHIYFDCGRSDFIFQDSEQFDAALNEHGVSHTYQRFDGVHDWDYWDIHIQDALKFHVQAMGL